MSGSLRFEVFANLYRDSVALMQIAAELRARDGIEQASCLMATPANLTQLVDAGLAVDAHIAPSDLLVVVRGDEAACAAALEAARALLLQSSAPAGEVRGGAGIVLAPTSLALGVAQVPDADLALISVPGDYAAAEALKALALGLHVMLFSDNVPIDEERAVKRRARELGRLVMGPDCGTAIVNGVPLGFANRVRRGDIGLVAASGTGLQEVTCRVHNRGGGVSQALGTGGRDLHVQVGGITMLQGLEALADDARTKVIVLVSKPPAAAIARRILDAARNAGKPVVVHFLGASREALPDVHAAHSLRHAAEVALALARGEPAPFDDAPPAAALAAIDAVAQAMTPSQRAVRGLFTGGTFCYEAQLAFLGAGLACRSNAPVHGAGDFDGRFDGHVFLDLGDDAYTRGRPHPMIDPALRNEMLRAQGEDASVAALLFDVVLGFGAHSDPAHDLTLALDAARSRARSQGRSLALIGHVCGTDGDPQGKAAQVARLEAAGALVAGSNIEAAQLAARLARSRA
jgi:succinyl-CoA synthetase alpha subunit